MIKFDLARALGIEEGVEFTDDANPNRLYKVENNKLMYECYGTWQDSCKSISEITKSIFTIVPTKQYTTLEMMEEYLKSGCAKKFKAVYHKSWKFNHEIIIGAGTTIAKHLVFLKASDMSKGDIFPLNSRTNEFTWEEVK